MHEEEIIPIPEPSKGNHMGAFEVILCLAKLTNDIRTACKIVETMMQRQLNAYTMLSAVELHLQSALDHIKTLKGDDQ